MWNLRANFVLSRWISLILCRQNRAAARSVFPSPPHTLPESRNRTIYPGEIFIFQGHIFPFPFKSFRYQPKRFYSKLLNTCSALLNICSTLLNICSTLLNKNFCGENKNFQARRKNYQGERENFVVWRTHSLTSRGVYNKIGCGSAIREALLHSPCSIFAKRPKQTAAGYTATYSRQRNFYRI